jgi:hypothetical protein
MKVTGTDVSDPSFAGVSGTGKTVTLDAGSFSVGEDAVKGYVGTPSGDCSGTAAIGDELVCTITNRDIAPRLTVVKEVENDAGGTLGAGDFTMKVTGTDVSDASFAGVSGAGKTVTLDAGSFSVGEDAVKGYVGTESGDCSGTAAIGDELKCTITNRDVAPRLTVVKEVENDAGGTLGAGDFTMKVTGTDVSDASFAGVSGAGKTVTLDAGSFSVGEDAVKGYVGTPSGDCSGTAAIGDELKCTITNRDVAPKLVVVKTVKNDDGGTKTAGDFTFDVTGTDVSDDSFAGEAAPGTTVTLDAGSYAVTEREAKGYVATLGEGCSGTVAIGETATCEVLNDDAQAKLTVIKKVVNAAGSEAVPADFRITIGGTDVEPQATFDGADDPGVTRGLDAGEYSVTEVEDPDFAATYSEGCSGTIAQGESRTCTITNRRKTGTLELVKALSPSTDAGRFDLVVDGTVRKAAAGDGGTTGALTVGTGTHTVSERAVAPALLTDYARSIVCSSGGVEVARSATGALLQVPVAQDGQVVRCVVTNRRLQVGLGLDKTGPATAQAGTSVPYEIALTNTGETSFPLAQLSLVDALCSAKPERTSVNGDTTPGVLQPGDRWTYACSVPTQVGETEVRNVASVSGTDEGGRPATATDDARTDLTQPPAPTAAASQAPQVLAAEGVKPLVRGRAALSGPNGCLKASSAAVYVTGRQIAQVRFTFGGKVVGTVKKADKQGRWLLRLKTRGLKTGAHKVRAVVSFTQSSQTRARTLQLTFSRCATRQAPATVG